MLTNRFSSKPVHLFVFTRQHLTWRYCTADRDLVIGGHTYLSAQIERGEIKQTIERAKDKLSIKFAYLLDPDASVYPVTQALGDNWWPYVPTDTVGVICLAYDAGTAAPPSVEWMGQVTQPKFGKSTLELICEPGNGYGRARGQGLRWQRGCGKTVYSVGPRGCNLGTGTAARILTGVVTRLEQANGDVPPMAHIVVPEFSALIEILAGRNLTWSSGGSSGVLSSFMAYTETIRKSFEQETSEFFWEPIGDRVDNTVYEGPFVIEYRYTKHPALVIANATGLVVGSSVSISVPAVAVSAEVTAVGGLLLTAPELALSAFPLAGGFITFSAPNGLLVRRDIATHDKGSAILKLTPGGVVPQPGDAITALPTCPRTWFACGERGNTDNYGGSLYKPVKNPMDGVSMSWG